MSNDIRSPATGRQATYFRACDLDRDGNVVCRAQTPKKSIEETVADFVFENGQNPGFIFCFTSKLGWELGHGGHVILDGKWAPRMGEAWAVAY